MFEFIERLKQGREEALKEKQARRALASQMQAQIDVQVTEYNGKMYISFDGVPLIEEAMLYDPSNIVKTLATIRETVVAYRHDEHARLKALDRR